MVCFNFFINKFLLLILVSGVFKIIFFCVDIGISLIVILLWKCFSCVFINLVCYRVSVFLCVVIWMCFVVWVMKILIVYLVEIN